jgi:hypothetical protein
VLLDIGLKKSLCLIKKGIDTMFYRVNAKWMDEDDRPEYDNPMYTQMEDERYLPNREQLISYLVDLTGHIEGSLESEIVIKPCCFATHKFYKVNDVHGREVFSNET